MTELMILSGLVCGLVMFCPCFAIDKCSLFYYICTVSMVLRGSKY